MKRSIKILLGCLLIIFVGLGGLFLYYYLNPKKAVTLIFPAISEVDFIKVNIADGNALATIHLNIKNERPYRMVIDSFISNIKLDKVLLISERIPLKLNLPRYAMDSIAIPVHFNISKIRHVLDSLKTMDSTSLNIEGYIIYNTIFGKTKLPFNKTMRINVPIPPEIKVLEVKRNKFSLRDKTITAQVKLQIINKGKYLDLELRDIHYDLKIDNTLSSKGVIEKEVSLKPSSELVMDIPIIIKLEHPLKTYLKVINDNDIFRYNLHLKCNLKEKKFDSEGQIIPVEVNSTGVMELVKD